MVIQGFRTEEVLRRKQPYWLSGAEWKRIGPLMPRGRRDAHRLDDRLALSGIIHLVHGVCQIWSRLDFLGVWPNGYTFCRINMFNLAITK